MGVPRIGGFPILENIFKGFVQWIYSLCLEMVQYIANSLLTVFSMDLDYFFAGSSCCEGHSFHSDCRRLGAP